tara:strand:- start:189 stop:554 length:366 start_codon:yes stop_codon:yes gene_type:complete
VTWIPKKKSRSKYERLSISKLLRNQKRTTVEFEVMLSQLKLEEIIGLKLELASQSIGGKLYGLPIIRAMTSVAQEASLYYVLSAAASKREAARFLGLNKVEFEKLIKKYNLVDYFSEQLDK